MYAVLLIITAIIALYFYGTRPYKYWEKRGIKYEKPIPFLGSTAKNFLMQTSTSELLDDLYWKYSKEPVFGIFRGSTPELVLRDPRLIKNVLNAEFQYFHQRGINKPKDVVEPMNRNLFSLEGDIWRLLRQRLTPAFTSGKLRAMFPLIQERAERLQEILDNEAAKGNIIDAKDLMARYSTDFIGALGFGLDANSLNDKNSIIRQLGNKVVDFSYKTFIKTHLKLLFPYTFRHVKLLNAVEQPIIQLTKSVMEKRNYEPSPRNDFMDLLLECKKKGNLVGESMEKLDANGKPTITQYELDEELLAAQAFVFFIAGFETSSYAISITLNELAHNPKVQRKVQEEIDQVLKKHNNKLTYEAIKEMTYLEWAVKEGLRIFAPIGHLVRECTPKKYTFHELNLTIDRGVVCTIPVQSMHMDPQFFPEPNEFRPERFDPEQFDPTLKYVYLPFGEGPRNCIGARLGLMQSLVGLVAVLSKFNVAPAPGAPRRPLRHPGGTIIQTISGGVPVVLSKRVAA